MKQSFEYMIEAQDHGERIDKFLASQLEGCTRGLIQREIKAHNILVNGKQVKANYKLSQKDSIRGHISLEEDIKILAEDIPLDVVYEDNDILLVNKGIDMVIHPAPGNYSGTLVNGLLHHTKGQLSSLGGEIRPGIVHRIDKDTTGLIVVAKNNEAHEELGKMFHDYDVTRKYHVIVHGNFKDDEGVIDAPIGRHPGDRTKMAVAGEKAREALTFYKVIDQFKGYSYLEVTLHTGRTHQIRVHMDHIGRPILGDATYGSKKKQPFRSTGPLLHAKMLGFNHPTSKEYVEFESSLPDFFQKALDNLPKT